MISGNIDLQPAGLSQALGRLFGVFYDSSFPHGDEPHGLPQVQHGIDAVAQVAQVAQVASNGEVSGNSVNKTSFTFILFFGTKVQQSKRRLNFLEFFLETP